jgi:hypothetical protein
MKADGIIYSYAAFPKVCLGRLDIARHQEHRECSRAFFVIGMMNSRQDLYC